MSEIYTVIVVILGILAISGLFVGVTNDAVNFLNSAIGSKAASMRVILTVASVGIIVGVVTSSGRWRWPEAACSIPDCSHSTRS